MVDAIDPQPGERVLELAGGPGETGFIAAGRIGPSGTLISSDQSPEMIEVAKRRASELGLRNVEFAVIDAQELALEPHSFDAVLCRFGFMLMAEPDAALTHTHRVLRPGGRLALAAWDTPDQNLWMAAPAIQLVARGALPMPDPSAAGPFSMADTEALSGRLAGAGFEAIRAEKLAFSQVYPSFEDYWQITLDLAAPITAALQGLDDTAVAEIRQAVHQVLGQFDQGDGSIAIPASAVVASARA
jgi:SAM-dependent methyltransferase